ncbi:MAG: prolyl oligopeptidase family serine peptidase, partial [Proteobacteria bacterium]|nr:prolyl oligopeptidase family serine peptidase [Pseudomonadota bacterium]
GKQYPILYRKSSATTRPKVVLDLNVLSKGRSYASLGNVEIKPGSTHVAYSIDFTGFLNFELRLRSIKDKEETTLHRNRVRSFAWGNDGRYLFVVLEDKAKRPYQVWRRDTVDDRTSLVYEEKDPRFSVSVVRSRSGKYLFVHCSSSTTSEVLFVGGGEPLKALRIFAKRRSGHEYYVEHGESGFYVLTNKQAKNFRVMFVKEDATAEKLWVEVIPHQRDLVINDIDVFKGHMIVMERMQGFPRLRVVNLRTWFSQDIPLPERLCSVSGYYNEEYDCDDYLFEYESYNSPESVYTYHFNSRKITLLKQDIVKQGYRQSQYATELIEVRVGDQAVVPVTIVYNRKMRSARPSPMLLTAYGAYGIPSDPCFSATRLSLLDRGIIFATAHVRGGGELGEAWHDQGKMLLKRHTFTDFIACTKHLIASGYTDPDSLVIQGGSAGGLLVAAVTNMAPELFCGVLADVPFVDVINTMLDETLPLTIGEFEEWGNPKLKAYYKYIKSYSPYENIVAQNYPAMLVQTSINDSQVMFWGPVKYVARLRKLKTDDRPLLLNINMDAGHGGASGRYDFLREIAFEYAFILGVFGLKT